MTAGRKIYRELATNGRGNTENTTVGEPTAARAVATIMTPPLATRSKNFPSNTLSGQYWGVVVHRTAYSAPSAVALSRLVEASAAHRTHAPQRSAPPGLTRQLVAHLVSMAFLPRRGGIGALEALCHLSCAARA
jgi:hypothetical protein